MCRYSTISRCWIDHLRQTEGLEEVSWADQVVTLDDGHGRRDGDAVLVLLRSEDEGSQARDIERPDGLSVEP